ncbi:InlB B-repeat-containing protein, partial [Lachnospiraceae bacterium OttesenSCG-928-E19]|nr:InlB B-repeat-containing protein [Lachnospiraceae bacterium OttesenSCG-928-E19]
TNTVTLNKNGGTNGTSSVTATYGQSMPTASMPTRSGWNFVGYYDTSATTGGTQYYTSGGVSARTWNKTINTTLYARWSQSVIKCDPGKYLKKGESSCITCVKGYYCQGGSFQISTTEDQGIELCPNNYINGSTGARATTDCRIMCQAGTRVAEAYGGCVTPPGDWYMASEQSVWYGGVSETPFCSANFHIRGTAITDHISQDNCIIEVPAGKYLKKGVNLRYFRVRSDNVPTLVAHLEMYNSQWIPLNDNVANFIGGENMDIPISYNTDPDYYATCSNEGCTWELNDLYDLGYIFLEMGSKDREYTNIIVDVSEDTVNWRTVLGPLDWRTGNGISYILGVPSYFEFGTCPAGKASAAHSVSLTAADNETCQSCAAGTHSRNEGAGYCEKCAVGSYNSGIENTMCYTCQPGYTTSDVGQTSCGDVCSNSNEYVNNWSSVSWNANNTVTNLCKITGCVGGYWSDSNAACSEVGEGYWSASGSILRNQCAIGLTTAGYGLGADEASDCGHILHYGDNMLYLNSAKKTTPSLYINIDGTIFYGNMSTANKNSLRINSAGTTYSVYDDTM